MKALKRAIMKVARSRIGGVLASFCVRRCLCLLPVKVEASSAEFVMMRHPQPIARWHAVIVPRRRFPDVEALLQDERAWAAFAAFAEAHVDFREVSMCCNFGARQEVKQVHFHVLSREALAEKADEETESFEMEGRKACFSSRGNAYMDAADLACAAFVGKAFSEEKSRRPGGFSLIWRLGQWG